MEMKPYYNKAECCAARLVAYVIIDDYKLALEFEDSPQSIIFEIHSGWNSVGYTVYPIKAKRMVRHPTQSLWLVARYHHEEASTKYSIVEDRVFQERFFSDDSFPLIEGQSFERPRRAVNG